MVKILILMILFLILYYIIKQAIENKDIKKIILIIGIVIFLFGTPLWIIIFTLFLLL